MNAYVVNIGLHRGDAPYPAAHAVMALALNLVRFNNVVKLPADGPHDEPRLVADVAAVDIDAALFKVAEALGQDCIALYDIAAGAGRLIGPKAAAWGEFQPAEFRLQSGARLA